MDMNILNVTDMESIPEMELCWNYQNMVESGKKELLKETEKILEIHKNEKYGG
jgi:hypothetical protein